MLVVEVHVPLWLQYALVAAEEADRLPAALAAALATARITALSPGQSPPPVTMPIRSLMIRSPYFQSRLHVNPSRLRNSPRPMGGHSLAPPTPIYPGGSLRVQWAYCPPTGVARG